MGSTRFDSLNYGSRRFDSVIFGLQIQWWRNRQTLKVDSRTTHTEGQHITLIGRSCKVQILTHYITETKGFGSVFTDSIHRKRLVNDIMLEVKCFPRIKKHTPILPPLHRNKSCCMTTACFFVLYYSKNIIIFCTYKWRTIQNIIIFFVPVFDSIIIYNVKFGYKN